MPSYSTAELHLKLSDSQTQTLNGLYKTFAQRMEDKKQVEPALINQLHQALKTVLTGQPFWQSIQKETAAFRHQMLHLVHTDNEVLTLPWHTAILDDKFIHLSKGFGTEGVVVEAFQPEKVLPLKILVVISMPDDLEETQRHDHEGEIERIIEAFNEILADAQVEIDFANDGTLTTLKEKLAQNAYHILHFSGHGVSSKKSDMGYLLMEDDKTFNKCFVDAKAFAEVLSLVPENRPELVVLSACESAKGFDSITRYLNLAGVPSVVSMNLSIYDYYATFFAAALYRNIVKHLKSREPLSRSFALAIAELRAEEAKYDEQYAQYLIPQLFTAYHIQNLVNYERPQTHALKFNAVKFATGEKQMLLEKQKGYTFVGRRAEIREAMPVLQRNGAVLLRGQGGVGKTALAEYLTTRLLLNDNKLYPFMLDEKKTNIEDLSNAMTEFLVKDLRKTAVPREASGIEKATDKFWFLFEKICEAGRFPLFIFDNLESFQTDAGGRFQEKHADLRDLIGDILAQTCPVIFTSRYPVPDFADVTEVNLNEAAFGDFYRKAQTLTFYELRHRLDALARDEAISTPMVHRFVRQEGADKADFKQVMSLLHNTLGGNYRALEFFDDIYRTDSHAAYATLEKLDAFQEQLAKDAAQVRLDLQDKDKIREKLHSDAKALVFDQLIALLSPEELQVLQLLEPFRVPVLPEAVAMQVPPTPKGELSDVEGTSSNAPLGVGGALSKLFDLTLIEQHEIGDDKATAYYVAPLVRDYLHAFLPPTPEGGATALTSSAEGKATAITSTPKESYRSTPPFGGSGGFDHKQAGDYFDKRVDITKTVDDAEEAYHHYYTAANKAQVNLYGRILCRHYFEKQIFRKAYDVGKQTEDFVGEDTEGVILDCLGQILKLYGQLDAALPYYERNLIQSRAAGDQKNEGATLNNLAGIARVKGDYDTASRYLEQSLAIMQQIGDRLSEGTTLNNISQIYQARGDYDTALCYLEQSLTIRQQIGDRSGEGTTLNNLATIAYAKGDYDTALRYLEQSLAIQQQIGDRKGESVTLNNIGQIHEARGDYDEALRYAEMDLAICQQIGDIAGLAATLNNMGGIYWKQQQNAANAIACFIQSYQINDKLGSPNVKYPMAYLNGIKGAIGEAAFEAILAAQKGK